VISTESIRQLTRSQAEPILRTRNDRRSMRADAPLDELRPSAAGVAP
jgi:hypothetical protein